MSKKSRRRNKKIAALAGLIGGAMLLGRGRGTKVSTPTTIMDNMPKGIDKVISDVPVSTPTTIQDSMPRVGMRKGDIRPKNPLSKRVMDDGRVFTIKGAKEGIAPKVGNRKSAFVSGNNIFKDGKAFTGGRFGSFKAQKEMERGMLPPQLRVPKARPTFDAPDFSDMDPLMISAKNGGMIVKGEKKAVRVKKKKGIQIKGFGKARK